MRDIDKAIANVEVPDRYQLTASELLKLCEGAWIPSRDDLMDAILRTFKYGFALGQRCERNRRRSGVAPGNSRKRGGGSL